MANMGPMSSSFSRNVQLVAILQMVMQGSFHSIFISMLALKDSFQEEDSVVT